MGFAITAIVLVLLGLIIFGIVIYIVGLYNELIAINVNIDKSWANIDVLLKQRYDELPKLVKVCEGYMAYEKDTLEKVISARTKYLEAKTPASVAVADNALAGALKSLFAVSERYPDLKANENFKQLRERVTYLENQIADRREFYNDSVAIFNTRIKQFPDLFIANMLKYAGREMYKAADAEKESPEIKFEMPK